MPFISWVTSTYLFQTYHLILENSLQDDTNYILQAAQSSSILFYQILTPNKTIF